VLGPGIGAGVLHGFERARRAPALTETLLDSSGRAIAVTPASTFTLANSYWQAPESAPTRGRCAMASSLPGVSTAWGEVATAIAPDPTILTPGWLTCLNTWFTLREGGNEASYEAAVLLNAKAPGKPPAMLWGAVPLAGHPGFFEVPAVQQKDTIHFPRLTGAQLAKLLAHDTKVLGRARALERVRSVASLAGKQRTLWDVFVPLTVARRVGPAWLLVRYGGGLGEQVRFLEALRVTKLDLRAG
jgi:hypothetical protein